MKTIYSGAGSSRQDVISALTAGKSIGWVTAGQNSGVVYNQDLMSNNLVASNDVLGSLTAIDPTGTTTVVVYGNAGLGYAFFLVGNSALVAPNATTCKDIDGNFVNADSLAELNVNTLGPSLV